MAFYHGDGFVASFNQATAYAGDDGHVATLPDVIDARLAVPPHDDLNVSVRGGPWDTYYTTMSSEFVGLSKGGVKIMIVAHGIGPMSTLEGVKSAYSHEFKDRSRSNRGGRISAEEFRKLEGGHYGEVGIIELEPYMARYQYPFISSLRLSELREDPLVLARLGGRALEYLDRHAKLARRWYLESDRGLTASLRSVRDPVIMKAGDASNCSYQYREPEDGMALAHLLSIGQISLLGEERSREVGGAWHSEVDAHEWWNGTRLIGVRKSPIATIEEGPDVYDLRRKHWQQLMQPAGDVSIEGRFFVLVELSDGLWFTQVDKAGEGMDNAVPEFRVTSIEPIGEPVQMKTDVRHYHGFFKYGKNEAEAVCPNEANAYALVGEPENVWEDGNPKWQVCMIQPYKVTVDGSARLMTTNALSRDYSRMMELAAA